MDLTPFKLDIDELLNEFTEGNFTKFADMKRIWMDRKFSYIYEARPTCNSGLFMQSLYSHCIGYIVSTDTLSRRLGALYCLYCLYETQPDNPHFKIYLSLGELAKMKELVMEAKQNEIGTVSALVKKMIEKNTFLFGSVDMSSGPTFQRLDDVTRQMNRRLEIAYEKLFANTNLEEYLHMDMGIELDLQNLKKMSADYEQAKNLAIKEASERLNVNDMKHIIEKNKTGADTVEEIVREWDTRKDEFYEKTGMNRPNQIVTIVNDFDELENLLRD